MSKNLAITFVLITVVIDAMGIGLMMPVMPDLLLELGADDIGNAATWGVWLSALFALMQFSFGPFLGALSDRFGRRPVLLLSLVVVMIDYILLGLAHTIFLVILARVIAGIASATQSTAGAYMADISKPEEKAQNFGLIGAAFGVGFVLGPVVGGLLSEFGTRAPFYAAAILAGANLVLGYFVFPETVTDKIRRDFKWKRANPFGALLHIQKMPNAFRLLFVIFIYNFAFMIYPAIWSYFTQEAYGWTAFDIGISFGCLRDPDCLCARLSYSHFYPAIGRGQNGSDRSDDEYDCIWGFDFHRCRLASLYVDRDFNTWRGDHAKLAGFDVTARTR